MFKLCFETKDIEYFLHGWLTVVYDELCFLVLLSQLIYVL